MADDEKLKRLGGGRWETQDGRYSIEPESGTWVVVDNEQTNELGLPLVRGPFPTLTAARAIWARLAGELAPVRADGNPAWILREDLAALRRAKSDRPIVRLLPYFDAFLMGHMDRAHLIDAAHYKRVYLPAGWIASVVLVDGRVAGTWSYERKGERLRMKVVSFHRLTRAIREGIEAEVADIARFFDKEHELRVA